MPGRGGSWVCRQTCRGRDESSWYMGLYRLAISMAVSCGTLELRKGETNGHLFRLIVTRV